ncbi:Alpha/Beta hydrolase protein [Epithele typhae]|uniref:Alpha/Beta hydrolase protein n=1 Tax=Epithele typhae TaxID=378194 RepID=UPI002008E1C4|nr:Alpha/Beta hydrolase protein [Epithele typhae]KAH9920257.1 Alpha/Beta hydrolase protein [Epithele typhae]
MPCFSLDRSNSEDTEPEGSPRPSVHTRHSGDFSPVDALRHFEYPGIPLPPSARVGDPKAKQRENEPIRLWHLWKYGTFAAVKATTLAADVSWGLEMTLLTSMMRDVSRYSHLTDIVTIRMLMSIGGLVPVPSDALVTPVSFPVRTRALRGILADFDAAENGKRELSGEWVVGRHTWRRLQAEWRARKEGKPPGTVPGKGKKKERVVLFLHGGAYYMFSAATHRLITIPLAKHLDARVFSLDYRLAPETRFPGPLHDAVSAYFRLVNDLHVPPENIVIAGDSAGGGLTLALLMYLRDNKYPLPSGAILMSPWVDLTMSCESWEGNAQFDIVPMPQPGDHMNPIMCYLGEHVEKYLTHPYASPLFGDFKGLPPLLIQAGEVEVLRDEITLLAHKASRAGVEVRHELYEDMVHVFQSFPFLQAARHAFSSCHDFVWNFLPQHQSHTPQYFEPSAEKQLEDEIDSNATRVVRGDGTETDASPEVITQDRDPRRGRSYRRLRQPESRSPTPGEEPSWGSMYLSSDSEEERDFGERVIRVQPKEYTPPSPTSPSESQPPLLMRVSSFSRLRATFNVITGAANASASTTLNLPTPCPSHPSAPSSPMRRRQRISSISMTSSSGAAPEPAIRRSQLSHPDISSLCKQWAAQGPANETTKYKPEAPPEPDDRRPPRALASSAPR